MIKNNLPNLLRDYKWQQKDLAEKSGVSENTISAIYNEKIEYPSSETMEKIAIAFKLDIGKCFYSDKIEMIKSKENLEKELFDNLEKKTELVA